MASTIPPVRASAFTLTFPILDTSGKLKTGCTFTSTQVSKDNGSFAAATNAPAELATASGVYTLALTSTEMTADVVAVKFVVATSGAQDVTVLIYTASRRIDDLAMGVAREGTAQAGTATTLQLDASASAVDSFYNGAGIIWTSGANKGVVRIVSGYVGATKTATFAVALPTTADATPTFIVTTIRHALPGTDGKALISSDTQDLSASLSVVKTGYALTAGEHTAIAADTQTGMTAQGYTGAALGNLAGIKAKTDLIVSGAAITLTSPVGAGGNVTVYSGDDYKAADARQLIWSTTASGAWPDLTGATVKFYSQPIYPLAGLAMVVSAPSGANKSIYLELTAAQTLAGAGGTYGFQIRATLADGNVATLVTGSLGVVS